MADKEEPDPKQGVEDSKQLANQVHWIQHATFYSQVGLGIIGIVALFIYYFQLQQMTEATKATRDAVSVASGTLAETVRSNKAQELASSLSFHATLDNFHQEQRAWVTINAVNLRPMKEGDFARIDQATVNGGKTLAFDVSGVSMMAFPETPLSVFPYLDAEHKPIKPRMLGLMVPGVPYSANIHSVATLNSSQIDAIKTGHLLIEGYGYLTYRDTANAWHKTEYCFTYFFETGGFIPCEKHNTAN